jgi:hypothetical protein
MNDDMGSSNPLDNFWMEGDSLAPPCQAEHDVIGAMMELIAPYANENSIFYGIYIYVRCALQKKSLSIVSN